jgi:peptide/nickel transport system ATP-binding protein
MVTQSRILRLLKKLQQDTGCSIVFITHDLAVVSAIADRVLVMYVGQAVEEGSTLEVMNHPAHPYTVALVDSAVLGKVRDRLQVIPGQPPELNELPAGCSFAPRCRHAAGECSIAQPPFFEPVAGRLCRCHRPLSGKSLAKNRKSIAII